MKLIKTFIAVVAAVCCLAVTSQASFTAVTGFTGTTSMATVTPGGSTVSVDYSVLTDGSLYYYLYQVQLLGTAATTLETFQVSVNNTFATPTVLSSAIIATMIPPLLSNAGQPDIILGGTIDTAWLPAGSVTANNVSWAAGTGLTLADQSIVLGFSSRINPTWGNGQATDTAPPSPWSTTIAGTVIPVPVPEPTTMIAGALLLLPFGASTLRFVRKSRLA
jgi:hypothetical protein